MAIQQGFPSISVPFVDQDGKTANVWYLFLASIFQRTGGGAGGNLATAAPLNSPTFTGVPAAPTALAGTNSPQLATTAFVEAAIVATGVSPSNATPAMDGTASPGTSGLYSRGDHAHPTDTSRAPLVSPSLTGTPTAPTATPGTNTTQIATTAFAQALVVAPSTTNPNMDGAVAVGSSLLYARGDHVHPSDTSRAPLASPVFTTGIGVFGHAVPGTQPAAPVTLADITSILQSYGLCA